MDDKLYKEDRIWEQEKERAMVYNSPLFLAKWTH